MAFLSGASTTRTSLRSKGASVGGLFPSASDGGEAGGKVKDADALFSKLKRGKTNYNSKG